MTGPLSYRNQSIDLQSKSMDWFLYDNSLRHERVKVSISTLSMNKSTLRDKINCNCARNNFISLIISLEYIISLPWGSCISQNNLSYTGFKGRWRIWCEQIYIYKYLSLVILNLLENVMGNEIMVILMKMIKHLEFQQGYSRSHAFSLSTNAGGFIAL